MLLAIKGKKDTTTTTTTNATATATTSKLRCQVIIVCSDLCPGCRKKTSLAVLGSAAQSSKAEIPDSCQEGSEPQSPGRRSHGRGRLEAATSAKRQDFRRVNAGVSRKKGLLLQMSLVITSEVLLRRLKLQNKEGLAKYGYGGPCRASSPGGGTSQVGERRCPRFRIAWGG